MKRIFYLILIFFLINHSADASLTIKGLTIKGLSVGVESPGGLWLAIGDSNTRGSLDTPVVFGWRDHLQDLLGIGLYDFVGPFTDPDSDATYDVDHSGQGGDETEEILARLDSNLDTYMPAPNSGNSIVSIMIGTNDIKNGDSQSETIDNVETAVETVFAHDSNLTVFVFLILPSTNSTYNTNFTAYNAALKTRLETLMNTYPKLHYVDVNAAFKTCNGGTWAGCLIDDLHPTDAGHQVIANAIYDCTQSSLNQYCDGN